MAQFWTEQSRLEVQGCVEAVEAVFPGSGNKMAKLLPELLCFGSGGNKDRPLLWLAHACVVLSSAKRALGLKFSPFDPLTLTKSELVDLACASFSTENDSSLNWDEEKSVLHHTSSKSSFSVARISMICGIANFLMTMDEFSHSAQFMTEVHSLDRLGICEADIREVVNVWAQRLYAYRRDHFRLYDATQTAHRLKAFFSKFEVRDVTCEEVLAYWEWDSDTDDLRDNRVLRSFSAAKSQVFAYLSAKSERLEVRKRNAKLNLEEVFHESSGPEGFSETDLSTFTDKDNADLTFEEAAAGLLKDSTVRSLSRWLSDGKWGSVFQLTVLRDVAFGKVGAGLANHLRTGKSRISKDDRILCVEAVPYETCLSDLYTSISDLTALLENIAVRLDVELPVSKIDSVSSLTPKKQDFLSSMTSVEVQRRALVLSKAMQHARKVHDAILCLKFPLGKGDEQFSADRMRFSQRYKQLYGGT